MQHRLYSPFKSVVYTI